MVAADVPTLEQGEGAFDVLVGKLPPALLLFLLVVPGLVLLPWDHRQVALCAVRDNLADVGTDFGIENRLQGLSLRVENSLEMDATAALDDAEHLHLVLSPTFHSFPKKLTADVHFVDFDYLPLGAEGFGIDLLHGLADALAQKPGGLVGDAAFDWRRSLSWPQP